ncbi:MAG: methyltransferase domain-containing protein [Methyloprofundus sp.]|nr:methyltransferase domain-containing protein [Methyloprofundus sp.]MBW6452750.1 methyltransferase domain-containing protein [Methyloprofundus sp.]
MNKTLIDKWNAIYADGLVSASRASEVLSNNLYLLPKSGQALDLACGLGANALLLAKQGLTVQAWDISTRALQKLKAQADTEALAVKTFTQEITRRSFSANSFDVVVVSRFLDRSICNAIMECLKLNGLLFYQTYTQHKVYPQGPENPKFLLADNEMLSLFSAMKVIYYRENSALGDIRQGLRNEVQFIGQKLGSSP